MNTGVDFILQLNKHINERLDQVLGRHYWKAIPVKEISQTYRIPVKVRSR